MGETLHQLYSLIAIFGSTKQCCLSLPPITPGQIYLLAIKLIKNRWTLPKKVFLFFKKIVWQIFCTFQTEYANTFAGMFFWNRWCAHIFFLNDWRGNLWKWRPFEKQVGQVRRFFPHALGLESQWWEYIQDTLASGHTRLTFLFKEHSVHEEICFASFQCSAYSLHLFMLLVKIS